MLLTREGLASEIRSARNEFFDKDNNGGRGCGYIVSRGVESSSVDRPPWIVGGYRQILPKLDGMDVMEFIQHVIDKKGMARILDVGCGNGRFLNQCKNGYLIRQKYGPSRVIPGLGKLVSCVGLTSCLYRFRDENSIPDDPVSDKLKYLRAGIHIEVADAQNLVTLFPEQEFDVITAVHVAEHVADPWSLFYGIYAKLSNEGAGFVGRIPFNLTSEKENESLVADLQSFHKATAVMPYAEKSAYAKAGDIAIKRNGSLKLPITYREVEYYYHNHRPRRIIYQYDPSATFIPV